MKKTLTGMDLIRFTMPKPQNHTIHREHPALLAGMPFTDADSAFRRVIHGRGIEWPLLPEADA